MLICELHHLENNPQLWTEWHDLLNRVPPDQRLFGPEWFSIWGRTIGSAAPWTGTMQVIAVRDKTTGRLDGVFPLGQPKVGMFRVNAMAGYFQPWRTIIADRTREFAVGRAIGWFLIELGWSVLKLGPWPMSADAHQGVLSTLDELGMPLKRQSSDYLAIADRLPATWDEYQDQVVGRRFLRRIRNFEHKLLRECSLEIKHIRRPTADQSHSLLAELASIEQRSWLSTDPNGRPRFVSPTDQEFWHLLTTEVLVPNDYLDCWLMRADGQAISFVWALTIAKTRYVIANSYDEAFASFRTGSILYRHMFQEGYERGVTRYDFGTNELHYKRQWGARAVDHVESFVVSVNRVIAACWSTTVKVKSWFCKSPTIPVSDEPCSINNNQNSEWTLSHDSSNEKPAPRRPLTFQQQSSEAL